MSLQGIYTIEAVFCGGCKNCRYMSHIAVFFGIIAVHRVYCGAFLDHCYKYSLLRRPTTAGHNITAIYMFNSIYIDIAALQRTCRNKYSICWDTIVAVSKTTVLCKFLAALFLGYSGGFVTATIDL